MLQIKNYLLFILILCLSTPLLFSQEKADKHPPVKFTLESGEVGLRYLLERESGESPWISSLQNQVLIDIRISFFKDLIYFDFRGALGKSNGEDYGDMGIGNQEKDLDLFIRRISMTYDTKKGVKLSAGALAPEYGAGSDNSYIDNNAHILGYRAKAKIEKGEFVITGGFLGDFTNPGIQSYFNDMKRFNYLQFVITKEIGKLVKASLGFNRYGKENFIRGVIEFNISKWVSVVDSITVEDMKSLNNPKSNAFAVTLLKEFKQLLFTKNLNLSLTYSHRTYNSLFPYAGETWEGHNFKFGVEIPDVFKFNGDRGVGIFLNYIQNVDDPKRVRGEVGVVLTF